MYYFSRIRHRRLFLEPQCKKAFLTVVQSPESIKGKTDNVTYTNIKNYMVKTYHKQDKWEILLLLMQENGVDFSNI